MNYHNITISDMLNGDGLRVVLWLAGCSHHCNNCQNQITWDCNGGIEFDLKAKIEIFESLKKDYISGITFSGGDPLFLGNREEVGQLIQEIHTIFPSKNIWLYTGYTWDDIKNEWFIPYIDVIVDGKYIEELSDNQLHWKGSSNQNVINVKESLKTGQVVLWNE